MDIEKAIKEIQTQLDSLPANEHASVSYHLFSDALIWDDETPSSKFASDEGELVFRYLLRYRSSLIDRNELESIASLWTQCRSAFPNWPGFRNERCEGEELQSLLRSVRAESERS